MSVVQRYICNRCSHIIVTKDPESVPLSCERRIDTKSMGTLICNGHYALTKGTKFKQQFGFSKTMKRNMKKRGVATVEEYRRLRAQDRKSRKRLRPVKEKKSKPDSKPTKRK